MLQKIAGSASVMCIRHCWNKDEKLVKLSIYGRRRYDSRIKYCDINEYDDQSLRGAGIIPDPLKLAWKANEVRKNVRYTANEVGKNVKTYIK